MGPTRIVCCAAAMYAAMAAPSDKNDQPKATSNGIIGFVFYAAFVVICAFCLLNLYVGVIFSEFSKIRLLSTAGSAFLTTKQQVRAKCMALESQAVIVSVTAMHSNT